MMHTEIVVVIPIAEATQMNELSGFRSGSFAGLVGDDVGRTDGRAPLVLLHGLTFDRSMWKPALTELQAIDPDRRAIAFDLPAHGASPESSSYSMESLVEQIHDAVLAAHLEDPVVVGHSLSAGAASLYAARYPTSGVISVEGTLRVGGFAAMAQSLEPVLRGPGFDEAWDRISGSVFRLGEVSPEVRDIVLATSQPRQAIVLGYWQDLFDHTPAELDTWTLQATAAVRASGVPFVVVLGQEPASDDRAWIRTNLPDARILVWPESGHFPHLAHPRRFAELLAESGMWVGTREVVPATA
jgi:pimeloyl-ACP methyl ester carboxylesterase